MKRLNSLTIWLFFGLYVLFVVGTLIDSPPVRTVDFVALIIIPAVALWGIYWVNRYAGEGLFGLIKRFRNRDSGS